MHLVSTFKKKYSNIYIYIHTHTEFLYKQQFVNDVEFTINFQGELSVCNNLGYGILACCIPYNETRKVSLKLGNEIRMLKHLVLLIKSA